jgi:hypothetical protein
MARSITHKDGNRTGNRLFASAVSRSTQSLLQFDRLLGASLHAEATAPAGIRVKNKRLLSAVDEQLQPPQHWEFSFLLRRNGPDDENVVRTNWNARSFCLAAHGVDDRHHNTRGEDWGRSPRFLAVARTVGIQSAWEMRDREMRGDAGHP